MYYIMVVREGEIRARSKSLEKDEIKEWYDVMTKIFSGYSCFITPINKPKTHTFHDDSSISFDRVFGIFKPENNHAEYSISLSRVR